MIHLTSNPFTIYVFWSTWSRSKFSIHTKHIILFILFTWGKSKLIFGGLRYSSPRAQEQENNIHFKSPVVEARADVHRKMDELQRSVSDYFPMIKRGFSEDKGEEAPEVVAMGWKHDVASRKEREEALR